MLHLSRTVRTANRPNRKFYEPKPPKPNRGLPVSSEAATLQGVATSAHRKTPAPDTIVSRVQDAWGSEQGTAAREDMQNDTSNGPQTVE